MANYNTDKEVWKDIKGYEGLYRISNTGKVKSLARELWNGYGYFTKQEAVLKPNPQISGYLNVHLYKEKIRKPFLIHRLVAKHFISEPDMGREVNHIDGDKTNNDVNNLEWVTPKENSKHARDTGLWNPEKLKGKNGKKVKQYKLDGTYVNTYPATTIAGEQFGKHSSSSIARACRGEYETSYGYKWEYV